MFLDIGLGIFTSIFASKFLGMDMNYILVLGSVLLALFPDIDFIMVTLEYGYTGKYAHNHRHLFHFPLVYLALFGSLIFAFFGLNWLIIFVIASFLHFLHDSIGIGWGVAWLFPLMRKNYKFFTGDDNKISFKFINSWNQEKLAESVEKYGKENWFKEYYLRPSLLLIIELLVFVAALISLYFYVK